jgi:hypothetical protein
VASGGPRAAPRAGRESSSNVRAEAPTYIDLTSDDYSRSFLSEGTMRVLKVSREEVKRMSVGNQTRYIVAGGNWPLEPLTNLSKRIEMWEWIVACLKKKGERGPFSHL